MLVVFVLVDRWKMHFVFRGLVVDFYVLTKHENIYEIQWAQNFSPLNVVFVDDQVHVYVNVEYKATNITKTSFLRSNNRHTSALFAANFTSIILAVGPFHKNTNVPVSSNIQSSSSKSS